MYAGHTTKRLCVRGAPQQQPTEDNTSAQQPPHHLTSTDSQTTNSSNISNTQQQYLPHPLGATCCNMPEYLPAATDDVTSIVNNNNNNSNNNDASNDGPINHKETSYSATVEQELLERLSSGEPMEDEERIKLILALRNQITACNKRKERTTNSKHFHRIVCLLDDQQLGPNVKTQLVLLFCSIAKGGEQCLRLLNEMNLDEKVLKLILDSTHDELIEACFRCFRSLMLWPKVSRLWLLYEPHKPTPVGFEQPPIPPPDHQQAQDIPTKLEKVVNHARTTRSFVVQECIFDILASTCCRTRDQALLHKASALTCIVELMHSPSDRVVMGSLNLLTQMCLKNQSISNEIVKHNESEKYGSPVLKRLSELMRKDRNHKLQFVAAQCHAHISRALGRQALRHPSIVSQVLPTLVRLVHKDELPYLRIKSAECIAYLLERETNLQSTASFCDRLIDSLANMLDCDKSFSLVDTTTKPSPNSGKPIDLRDKNASCHWLLNTTALDLKVATSDVYRAEYQLPSSELAQEMKRAAFLALAALSSNLELIRKKIFTTDIVLQHLIKSLIDNEPKTLKSALTCLLSLSRSVQQLRTNFAENSGIVYSALKNLLTTASNDILPLVLAILCNISLEFSPGKQHFLDPKTIDLLCSFTKKADPELRLHGIWILMNMVYQLKDPSLKFQIIGSLGINHLLSLLDIEDDDAVVIKTLGFLRNLLSSKSHTDSIMNNYGAQIMKALITLLTKPNLPHIQEQALCVLTNIADGTESKKLIISNRVILAYLARTMCDEQKGDLRLAAILCITNLANTDTEGSYERRDEMRKYGIEEKLKYLLNSNDPILSDRVRAAYSQFHLASEDKYGN